jgi:hypothetical protein
MNCNLFSFSNNQTRFLGVYSKEYQDEFGPGLLIIAICEDF